MSGQMSLQADAGTILGSEGNHTSPKHRIAAALRCAMAMSRYPVKELARKLDRTPKGASLLLNGEVAPSLETLIVACREYDAVWEEMRILCGRANTESDAEALLSEITQKLRGRLRT